MCKYCEELNTGNSSEYLNFAKVYTNGVLAWLIVSIIEENADDQPVLCTIMMNDHGETIASDEVIVRCCPVCGRKFTHQ